MNLLSNILKFVKDYNGSAYVFQAGGSLLSHPTRDFDFLVMLPGTREKGKDHFIKYVEGNHSCVGSLVEINEAYADEVINKRPLAFPMSELSHLAESDGVVYGYDGYDVVVKLESEGRRIDLLVKFGYKSRHDFIFSAFGFFPLSIQHIALDLETFIEWTSSWQKGPIIFFSSYGKSYEKYRGYYPDRQFKPLPGKGIGVIPF